MGKLRPRYVRDLVRPSQCVIMAPWREEGSVGVFHAFPTSGYSKLPSVRGVFDEGLSLGDWGSQGHQRRKIEQNAQMRLP